MISEYTPNFLLTFALFSFIITVFIASLKNTAISNLIALFIVIIYVVVFGLRDYSIGSDTEAYVENFIYDNWDFEPLFTVITYLIKLFTNSPTIYLIILSIIYGLNIYLSYIMFGKKSQPYIIIIFIWSVLFSQGMLTGTINYFRQALGFSFLLLGLGIIFQRGKINCLSCFLILSSTLIHSSNSIILLLLILSRYINIRVILLIYFISLFLFLGNIGQFILEKFGDFYIIKRSLARHIYFNDRRSDSTIYIHLLLYSINFLLFLFFYKIKKHNKKFIDLLKIYGLMLSLAIFISFNREMAIRYYILLQYILPILYMYTSAHIKQKLIFSILFSSYTILYLYYLLNRPWFTDQFLGNITS